MFIFSFSNLFGDGSNSSATAQQNRNSSQRKLSGKKSEIAQNRKMTSRNLNIEIDR